ncbi:hypothetical protein ACFV6N_11995, partial [Streptomyces sp. NPDC059819]
MSATPEPIGRGHAQLRLTILKPDKAVIFDLTRSLDTRSESLARPANALITFPGKTRTVTLDWSAGGSIEGACTDVQVYPPPPHDQLESCGAGPLVASGARGKYPQEAGSTAMISKATRAGGPVRARNRLQPTGQLANAQRVFSGRPLTVAQRPAGPSYPKKALRELDGYVDCRCHRGRRWWRGAEYRLTVVGDAAGWARVEPAVLRLYPGAEGVADITFAPPRTSDAIAGPSVFGIRVDPREHPH